MNIKSQLTTLLTLLLNIPLVTHAIEYQKGYRALEIFDAQGLEVTPLWVMVWIVIATLCFAAGLLFVKQYSIARWVVGGYIAGFMFLVFSSLLGLVQLKLAGFNALIHIIFWSPSLYLLIKYRPFISSEVSAFSIWSGIITLVMLFSFIFDIPYAVTFLRHIFFDIYE